jgi:hypothetical protein
MIVLISNLTDAPSKRAREVRIFNTRILPGKSARIPAQYVDAKMRALESAGHISIGAVPAWYSDHKSRRVLTADEVAASRKHAADVAKAKADAKKKFLGTATPMPVAPPTATLAVTDEGPVPTDSVDSEKKSKKNKKRG